MPHAALWVVQRRTSPLPHDRFSFNAARGFVGGAALERLPASRAMERFNAARGFVGGAAKEILMKKEYTILFQCRTRLCGWCSRLSGFHHAGGLRVSMPHAALWVVQLNGNFDPLDNVPVSMPHAALWVVQHLCPHVINVFALEFQCRTRLCGWCSVTRNRLFSRRTGFQCRTRLCGWCSFVARSPCPPRGKKPFWKVSGNLRCLTENM